MPQLNNATIGKLATILPLLPPGYMVWAPYHANTYTVTGGPQFNYRHFKYVTLFIHPDIGAMYQTVTVHPQDQIMTGIVTSLLGPTMKTSQWTSFYGVGGGFDLNVSKHVGLRFQSDWVYTQLSQNQESTIHVAHVSVADIPPRKERTKVSEQQKSHLLIRSREPISFGPGRGSLLPCEI